MQRKKLIFAILALLPAMGIYFWVRLIPIGETLRLSLHQWNILSKNKPFVGLDNFRELFGDPLFLESLFNTTIIAFGVLLITIPSSLFIAYLVFQRTRSRFAGFYETTLFLPHVVGLVSNPGLGFLIRFYLFFVLFFFAHGKCWVTQY